MKLFFSLLYPENKTDYFKNKHSNIGDYVVVDLRLKEILTRFINDAEHENAVLIELSHFCNDKDIILYRQNIINDILKRRDIMNFFNKIRQLITNIYELFNLKMFKDDPQMSTLKTFLVAEEFTLLYENMVCDIELLEKENISEEMKAIFSSIIDDQKQQEIMQIKKHIEKIRNSLDNISEIYINRFFSRGQNIENSILTDCDGQSITSVLEKLAEGLGIQKPLGEDYRAKKRGEPMKKLLFRAYSAAHKDVFDEIQAFHNSYKDFFDVKWFELIHEIYAVCGFAAMFQKIKDRGLSVCPSEISENKDDIFIHNLYSLFLIDAKTDINKLVFNDYFCNNDRSFNILLGPNGGGKTIFLSAVGLCYIFFQSSGYIFADSGCLTPLNGIYTHFPVEETNDAGRLKEEIKRADIITSSLKQDSLVLLNETFSGTKTDIALELSLALLKKLTEKKTVGIFVTHFHELREHITMDKNLQNIGVLIALIDEKIGRRLYKIVPLKAQKGSYSADILLKHGMTRSQLFDRVQRL